MHILNGLFRNRKMATESLCPQKTAATFNTDTDSIYPIYKSKKLAEKILKEAGDLAELEKYIPFKRGSTEQHECSLRIKKALDKVEKYLEITGENICDVPILEHYTVNNKLITKGEINKHSFTHIQWAITFSYQGESAAAYSELLQYLEVIEGEDGFTAQEILMIKILSTVIKNSLKEIADISYAL